MNLRFILPLLSLAARGPRLVAVNEAAAGELTLPDARGMLLQALDLDKAANDQQIRDAFANLGRLTPEQQAAERAANERREAVCVALSLPKTASSDEVHAAILAVPGRITAANDAKTAAETSLKTERGSRAKLLLDAAINEGRITGAQRGEFETAFNGDFAATETRLAAEKKKLNADGSPLGDLGARKPGIANARERQAAVTAAVNERIAKTGETWDVAWHAVKADPAHKGLFEAMAQPGKK